MIPGAWMLVVSLAGPAVESAEPAFGGIYEPARWNMIVAQVRSDRPWAAPLAIRIGDRLTIRRHASGPDGVAEVLAPFFFAGPPEPVSVEGVPVSTRWRRRTHEQLVWVLQEGPSRLTRQGNAVLRTIPPAAAWPDATVLRSIPIRPGPSSWHALFGDPPLHPAWMRAVATTVLTLWLFVPAASVIIVRRRWSRGRAWIAMAFGAALATAAGFWASPRGGAVLCRTVLVSSGGATWAVHRIDAAGGAILVWRSPFDFVPISLPGARGEVELDPTGAATWRMSYSGAPWLFVQRIEPPPPAPSGPAPMAALGAVETPPGARLRRASPVQHRWFAPSGGAWEWHTIEWIVIETIESPHGT